MPILAQFKTWLDNAYSLVESCKANKVNPLTYLTYVLANARNKSITLPTPDEFAALNTAPVGGCAL